MNSLQIMGGDRGKAGRNQISHTVRGRNQTVISRREQIDGYSCNDRKILIKEHI